jgi:Bax protein
MNVRVKIFVVAVLLFGFSAPVWSQEVVVFSSLDETIAWFKARNWWGEEKRGEQLSVPHSIVVAISDRWQQSDAPYLPVAIKKEVFYRFMLPLAVHANSMVMDRRKRLKRLEAMLGDDIAFSAEDNAWLYKILVLLRIADQEKVKQITDLADLQKAIAKALYKLDIIPVGLVLAQAAYESGYSTSRFAVKGNALFGQWTFGGKGILPEHQRRQLGNYRIARFEWLFDSVRSYFINLNSHPAYEDFRRLRAEIRTAGKSMSSVLLAEGLKNYSERGQIYVDTLKSIIRVNNLDIADNAVFRDEPIIFLVGATDQATAAKLRVEIETMRKSGELNRIIERMQLE